MLDNQDEFEYILDQATKEKHASLVYNANKSTPEEAYLSFKCSGDDVKFKLKF